MFIAIISFIASCKFCQRAKRAGFYGRTEYIYADGKFEKVSVTWSMQIQACT